MSRHDSLPDEYIEIDWGGQRFTHYPTGDTLLRHEWLRKHSGHSKWRPLFQEFINRHPNAHVMFNREHGIIDDVRRWPLVGGSYEIGDKVICRRTKTREWDQVRTIVERLPDPGERPDSILSLGYHFKLDNGELLYWDYMQDAFHTRNSDGDAFMRVRPATEAEIAGASLAQ